MAYNKREVWRAQGTQQRGRAVRKAFPMTRHPQSRAEVPQFSGTARTGLCHLITEMTGMQKL